MSPGEGRVASRSRVQFRCVACLVAGPDPGLPGLPLLPPDVHDRRVAGAADGARAAVLTRRLGGGDSLAAGLLVLLVIVAIAAAAAQLRRPSSRSRRRASSSGCAPTWSRRRSTCSGARRCRRSYPLLMAWVRRATGGAACSTASYGPLAASPPRRTTSRSRSWPGWPTVAARLRHLPADAVLPAARRGRSREAAARHLAAHARAGAGASLDHLTRTVKGVLQSMVLVPIAQGVVALFGFLAVRRARRRCCGA